MSRTSSFAFDAVPPLLRIAAPSSRLPPPRSHARVAIRFRSSSPSLAAAPLARASARARRRRLEHPREVGVGPVREPVRVRRRSELGEDAANVAPGGARPPRRPATLTELGARSSRNTARTSEACAEAEADADAEAPGVGTPRGRRRPGLPPRALFSSPPKTTSIIILAEIRRVGGFPGVRLLVVLRRFVVLVVLVVLVRV